MKNKKILMMLLFASCSFFNVSALDDDESNSTSDFSNDSDCGTDDDVIDFSTIIQIYRDYKFRINGIALLSSAQRLGLYAERDAALALRNQWIKFLSLGFYRTAPLPNINPTFINDKIDERLKNTFADLKKHSELKYQFNAEVVGIVIRNRNSNDLNANFRAQLMQEDQKLKNNIECELQIKALSTQIYALQAVAALTAASVAVGTVYCLSRKN